MQLELLLHPTFLIQGKTSTFRVRVSGEDMPEISPASDEDESEDQEENLLLPQVCCRVSGIDYVVIGTRRCEEATASARPSKAGRDLVAEFRIEPHSHGILGMNFSLVGHNNTAVAIKLAVSQTDDSTKLPRRGRTYEKGLH